MSLKLTQVKIVERTIKKKKKQVRRKGNGKDRCEMKAMVCRVQKSKGGKKSGAEAQRSAMESTPKERKSEERFEGGR